MMTSISMTTSSFIWCFVWLMPAEIRSFLKSTLDELSIVMSTGMSGPLPSSRLEPSRLPMGIASDSSPPSAALTISDSSSEDIAFIRAMFARTAVTLPSPSCSSVTK